MCFLNLTVEVHLQHLLPQSQSKLEKKSHKDYFFIYRIDTKYQL